MKEIAHNKSALHHYFIEERLEAGLSLLGWEAKSLRAGRVQLKESHVLLKRGELFLFNANITPFSGASTHVNTNPTRDRKLLLHAKEIASLIGKMEQKGYTLIPLSLYWKQGKIKCELGLAVGKKKYDKRETLKQRDWERQKQRILKKI